jgi:hypothetical protein
MNKFNAEEVLHIQTVGRAVNRRTRVDKFKIGDKVKIVGPSYLGSEDKKGQEATIIEIDSDGDCTMKEFPWRVFNSASLELVKSARKGSTK